MTAHRGGPRRRLGYGSEPDAVYRGQPADAAADAAVKTAAATAAAVAAAVEGDAPRRAPLGFGDGVGTMAGPGEEEEERTAMQR